MKTKKLLVFGLVLAAIGIAFLTRHAVSSRYALAPTTPASAAPGDVVLHIPHVTDAITLDGEMAEQAWVRPPGAARTGEFLLQNGQPARPHTSARLVWSGDYLYMAVLASDEDIRSDDAVHVAFHGATELAIDVSPRGVIMGSIPGVRVAADVDGVIDQPKGFDEEWTLELAIPFASLGMKGVRGESIGLSMSRCDTPKDGVVVCAGWGDVHPSRGRIVLE